MKKTYVITFLPEGQAVRAAQGRSILDAAKAAGIPINCICNGDGVCGKCRVMVKSGKVTARPNMFLDRHDIQRGMALACQTYVAGDVVVEVPPESRGGGIPHLVNDDAVRFGKTSVGGWDETAFPLSPLVSKVYLELPKPSLDDSLSDQERLYRSLRQKLDLPIVQTGLSVMRRFSEVLRRSDWKVTVLLGCRGGTVEVVDVEPGDTVARNYGVALDVGTTTIVTYLVDLTNSETLAVKARYNSQARFGEDVIARIMRAASPDGLRELQETVAGDINGLIAALIVDAGVRLSDVNCITCAGNTTMVHLLFGLDPANIRREPYVPCAVNLPVIRAAEVGITINARGLLATMPCVASYVGGDVLADVLVSGMTRSEELSLLVDLGTNGELVLGNSEWLMACSASAGPAFEGGGISCGMRATSGAVERVVLGPGGQVLECNVVGGGSPLGLCGSGLIDAVAGLLEVGCIDRAGRFVPDRCGRKLQEMETGDRGFVLFPGQETALGRDIVLAEADIANLIHTKGSIYMAAVCLLEHVGLSFDDVKHIYIAGGFGNHLQVDRAVQIGLLPDVNRSVFHVIGNGSVQGARMALLSGHALRYTQERIAAATTYVELSSSHRYMNEYSSCLFLPHTDIERFPSVARKFNPQTV
ncbi:MAG: hypothetical protein A3K19_25260 [Lentisphaerae bacterium RIFOXYB12_FULL_65_16]|nr:MAG: hypothetical protein A3K18_06615 [Lentisphaerae bacterium RIFOXYA12_64_32]OGV91130.1 MAG: hypothetical protein A3K19_25260 [Lentisphaerae bacterium RIFOXYB12_FULL_65_16]